MMNLHNRALRAGAAFGVALLALTGCASSTSDNAATKHEKPAVEEKAADSVTIEDTWVKAAESGMTAGFGLLKNSSDHDVTVVSVESPASPMLEMHETVKNDSGQMQMRQVEGGFVIPANGHMQLEPGGNHLMLMKLPQPIKAGEEVAFTLNFSDGSVLKFTAVAKDFAGANENYQGDSAEGDLAHGDMAPDAEEHSEH